MRSHQCGISILFNISSCCHLSEGKKKVFHSGKLTQNASQPKERARKVQLHEEKPPNVPVLAVLEHIKRSLTGVGKNFSSVLHHVLVEYTAQTVEWITVWCFASLWRTLYSSLLDAEQHHLVGWHYTEISVYFSEGQASTLLILD